ncbi:MAG: SAM-dependent methyltransferase [Burkholderiales bacterium]|nr:SAM-dependent methyltransferase [Burkholderiales bacterium]
MSTAGQGAPEQANSLAAARGRLVLVPNTLDLGAAAQELSSVLPLAVLQWAARLQYWLVEDAKSARAFLKRVHACVPLQSPLQALSITELPRPAKGRNEPPGPASSAARGSAAAAMSSLLAPALAGHDVGLLSEAGLPAVADPGAAIVAAAHGLGLQVLPLPGPSSLLLALAASGLDGQSFAFVGYLPQDAVARCERIRELEGVSRRMRQTQIFIETPYRNAALMGALLECAAPATRLAVSVGLTLPGGWNRTATVAEWRRKTCGAADLPDLPDRLPAVFLLQA